MLRWWLVLGFVAACSTEESAPEGGAAGSTAAGAGGSAGADAGVGGAAGSFDAGAGSGGGGAQATGGGAGTAGAAGAAGDAGTSGDAGQGGSATDACVPATCDSVTCGALDDGCGGSLFCKCYGPYTCIAGACIEVAFSFCGTACQGEFTTLVQTIPNTPCSSCTTGGDDLTICTKPGTSMNIIKEAPCPDGHHFTQAFKDCSGVWWYPCIPD
jgi:hypothetical protein